MSQNRLSVVTVSWNTGPHLIECVSSVLAAAGVDELVLVSHENPPETLKSLQNLEKDNSKFKLIVTGKNLGFAKGCNIGAKQARGDLVLFLNPDAVLNKDVATRLKQSAMTLTHRPWMIGARLLNTDNSEQRGGRRGILTPRTALVSVLGLHKLSPKFKSIHQEGEILPGEMHSVPTVSGAAMMMLREDFLKIGNFDERYFLHVEDIDICRTIRDVGGNIWFEPRAEIMHYGRTSRASSFIVETHKAIGFVKYFWKFYTSPVERIITVLMILPIFAALWGRVIFLELKTNYLRYSKRFKAFQRFKRIRNVRAQNGEVPSQKMAE